MAACDTSWGQTRKTYVGRKKACRKCAPISALGCALAARRQIEVDVDQAVREELRTRVPRRLEVGIGAIRGECAQRILGGVERLRDLLSVPAEVQDRRVDREILPRPDAFLKASVDPDLVLVSLAATNWTTEPASFTPWKARGSIPAGSSGSARRPWMCSRHCSRRSSSGTHSSSTRSNRSRTSSTFSSSSRRVEPSGFSCTSSLCRCW